MIDTLWESGIYARVLARPPGFFIIICCFFSDDEEEDDFSLSKKAATKEITQQLIKDGYNLDLEPDDEDLDLIPPRPLNERCVCCQMQATCALQ